MLCVSKLRSFPSYEQPLVPKVPGVREVHCNAGKQHIFQRIYYGFGVAGYYLISLQDHSGLLYFGVINRWP